LFRNDSQDGENVFADENKVSWLHAFTRGAKRTNQSRAVRSNQTGRVRKKIASEPKRQKSGTWSLW
jgi:hypothetical protein